MAEEAIRMDDVELNSDDDLEDVNLSEVGSEGQSKSETSEPSLEEKEEGTGSVAPTVVPDISDVDTRKETSETLRQLRKSKTPEQEVSLATKLASLSKSSDSKAELQRNIPLLVDMLREGSIEVQKSILQILQSIGTSGEAKKNLKKSGGVKELVRCITIGGEIRVLALNVLGFTISKDEENAREFVDEGGIQALFESLSDEEAKTRFLAAACSWVLASYIRFQENLVENGFVEKTLELINDREDISWQAMGTLRNLVIKNEQVHQIIMDNNGLQKFRDAIQEGSTVSLRSQQLIVQTLFVITSTNSSFKSVICEHDMLPVLLYQISTTQNVEFSVKILQLLVNLLAKNKENQDRFRELNGLVLLFDILANNESEEVCSGASTALWASTINNEESIEALTGENIQYISQSLILSSQAVLVGLVATLSNIANSSEKGQNLVREGNMIPLIVDYLRASHAPLLEATAGALMALCRGNDENGNQILEWDGALLLARNLSASNNGVKQNVAGALRLLLELNFNKTLKAIKEVSGVESLLGMLKEKTRPQLQTNAAHCLLLLAERTSSVRDKIAAANGQYAISVSLDGESEKLQGIICDLIACLAKFSEDFRVALGNEDVVSKVIAFVEEENEVVVQPALRSLWALCLNNDNHQQIVRASGMIQLLIERLTTHSTSLETKALILRAIASICGNNYKNQEIFRLDEKGIPVLISSLLLSNSDPDINAVLAEPTTLALWCLSTGNSRMQTSVREKQGLVLLVEMLRGNPDSPTIMLNTIGALCELCRRCNANKKIVKEAGLLDLLNPIESHENRSLADIAKELRTLI